MRDSLLKALKNPVPIYLLIAHTCCALLLLPIVIATINTETAPMGLGLFMWMDFLVLLLPEISLPGIGWTGLLLYVFLVGSLQWYLIGVAYVLLMNFLYPD